MVKSQKMELKKKSVLIKDKFTICHDFMKTLVRQELIFRKKAISDTYQVYLLPEHEEVRKARSLLSTNYVRIKNEKEQNLEVSYVP